MSYGTDIDAANALKEKYEIAKELIEANLVDLEKIRAEKSA